MSKHSKLTQKFTQSCPPMAPISPYQPLSAPISLRQKKLLQIKFAVQVSWVAMRLANNLKIYLALISHAWILNICRLSNGPF